MKSVLISIQPKWCELIASGKKTVEVRKTKPKLKTPFKVYIYCTYGQGLIENNDICYPNMLLEQKVSKNAIWGNCCNGKVIGEFVCDKIFEIEYQCGSYRCKGLTVLENDRVASASKLSLCDMRSYLSCNNGYGWHISNLVIYDKPRELGEFYIPVKDYWETYDPSKYINGCWQKPLQRPPQSWCYVESEDKK
ncbi:MAG: hypothetical protein U0L72_00725 [Acutalibacteraceae bacterium]|nr:hypothetical protein [Acutalibacteraceae bacterium]